MNILQECIFLIFKVVLNIAHYLCHSFFSTTFFDILPPLSTLIPEKS